MLLGWAAVRPSYGFDPLNYHLPLMAAVFRTGSFTPVHFPPYFETFPYFTMNGDLFGLWAMLSSGDASLLPFANCAPFLLLGLVLYAFARDWLPSRAAAAALTSTLLTVPAFFVLLADAYVEIPLWAFMFASLRLILMSGAHGNHRGLFALAGAMCGAMIGTKLTGIPMAMVLLATWLFCTPRQGPSRAAVSAATFMAATILFGGYFYVRNMLTVGSPVYPFPMSFAGIQFFQGDNEHAARVAGTTIRRFLAPLVFSGDLFKAMIGTRTPPNSSWGLGITGPVMMVAAFAGFLGIFRAAKSRRGSAARISWPSPWVGPIFLGGSLLAILVYINLPWCAPYLYGNVRFVYPAVPFAALALVSVPSIASVKRWFSVVVCLFLQLVSFLMASVPLSIGGFASLVVAVALVALLAWLAKRRRFADFAGFVPPAAAIVVIIAAVSFRLDPVDAYRNPGFESGPSRWASERADCLGALEKTLPAGRFALTMARGAPHAWFIFPLLGDRFERQPVYVDVSPAGRDGNLKSADALPGYPGADRAFWMAGLATADVDALVILNDVEDTEIGRTPVEFSWAAASPSEFKPTYQGRLCSVYRLALDPTGTR
jgi:hypothetical protein